MYYTKNIIKKGFYVKDRICNGGRFLMRSSISYMLKNSDLTEQLIESLPYFICITNEKGEITYINKKGIKILNRNKISNLNQNISNLYNKYEIFFEDGTRLEKKDYPLYKAINYKKETTKQVLFIKSKSVLMKISASVFPLLKDNNVIGSLIILISINNEYLNNERIKKERKRFIELSTELKTKCDIIETLRNKEKEHLMHLKDVINNISEGIMVFDTNTKLSLCNKAVFKILQLNPIEIINESSLMNRYDINYMSDNIRNQEKNFFNLIKIKKTLRNVVIRLKNRVSSEITYVEINVSPISDKNNKLIYTIMTIKDVTEAKLHELNAEEQATFIKNVVDTVDIPIAVVDYPKINYSLTNKKFENIIEYEDNTEYIEKYKKTGNVLYKILVNVGKKNKSHVINSFKIKDENGEDRFYKMKFVPYSKENNIKIHIYGSDITEEMNRNIELEKITKLKDEFFTIVSHELRTPITIIYSSLQLANNVYNKEITPNIGKTFSRISQNCSRLLKLINNTLDISKAEAGFLSINSTEFDIVYVSETIINSSNCYAVNKKIELIFDTNEEEINVMLDKEKYEKILLNLLSNAIKFTPEGKKIIVSLKNEKEYFYLNVKDFGIGIPEDKIESIFDRFCQINKSLSRRAEGTGMGLTIVKKMVELMNGEIKVKSKIGSGTEFIVKFKKLNLKGEHVNNSTILTQDINSRISIEFSDIN